MRSFNAGSINEVLSVSFFVLIAAVSASNQVVAVAQRHPTL